MIVHARETVKPFLRDQIEDTEVSVAVGAWGEIVGFLALAEPDHLNHLYLIREHTGRGLGTGFLALAKERFPGGIQLWAFQSNTAAIRFYERHGFRQVRWTDGDNDEGEPDVLLEWPGASVRR